MVATAYGDKVPTKRGRNKGFMLPPKMYSSLPEGAADAVMAAAFPQEGKYVNDPVGWVTDVAGEFLWSKQREVCVSVRDNRYTAVHSAHQTGKSFVASRIAAWWIDQHPPGEAFVVTSAPTQTQVAVILWREIGKVHRKANLSGYVTKGTIPEWKLDDGETIAYGRKPADKVDPEEAMQAFQGIHARYVLVILDEACGVPEWLYDAADALVGNDDSRVLAIGNPDNPASHFRKVCRPGSGWNVIHISALHTPNFTGEWVPDEVRHLLVGKTWVKERIKRWGKKSPIFISKVLGLFPKVSTDTLISPELLERAMKNDRSGHALESAGRLGVDIADSGHDHTVIYLNRNGYIRLAKTPQGEDCDWHGQNTMITAGKLKGMLDWFQGEVAAVIDGIGVGAPVVTRMRELRDEGTILWDIHSFKAGNKAKREDKFVNARSEQWWAVRELFEAGEIDLDPDDEDLIAQLGSIKWSVKSNNKTFIEPKDETKKRAGGESPDRADAFMMSTFPWDHLPPEEEREEFYAERRKLNELAKAGGGMPASGLMGAKY